MTYPVMSTSIPWSLVKSGFHKSPSFADASLTHKAPTGHRSSLSLKPYATWNFEVDLNRVLGGESIQGSILQSFLGCYLATNGGAGFFLFTDPNDNAVTTVEGCMLNVTPGAATPMGETGDGISTKFQLARSIGQGTDIIQQASNVLVYVDGVEAAATIGDSGIVTFASAPAIGKALTWSGSFRYLCQFADDTLKDLSRMDKNASGWLWSCGSIAFESLFI